MGRICRTHAGALLAFVGIAACALLLRVPYLNQRPMHGDEANQAVRAGILLETGQYRYDPTDHHGPVLYFAALPFCRMTARTFASTTEWNFRLVPVVFGMLTLVLMTGLGLSRNGGLFENRVGLYCAILLTALSPAMAYFSRFFIQETMLVTFLTGMMVCGRLYAHARTDTAVSQGASGSGAGAALGFGIFAGLSVATKETAVLSFAALAFSALAAFGWHRLRALWNTGHAVLAVAAAAVVAALFFSSFLTYPQGVTDALFSTVSAYLARATKVIDHQHPWHFYLKTLFWFRYGKGPVWSEAGLLVPALLAAAIAWLPRRRTEEVLRHACFVRFVLIYTLVLTALYSAIPYKTPWCVLSFLHGYILLAGVGVGAAFAWLRQRPSRGARGSGYVAVSLLVCVLGCRHAAQAYRACFILPADPRNPYVYAHTGPDALNLVSAVEEAARRAQGYGTLIAVAVPTSDTWPLPWYLRKYTHVGFWTRVEQIPESVSPAIVIAAADQGNAADIRFGQGKQAAFFGIRPGVLLNVFVPDKAK